MARTLACRVTSFSAYHSSGLMKMLSASWEPESTPESRVRL